MEQLLYLQKGKYQKNIFLLSLLPPPPFLFKGPCALITLCLAGVDLILSLHLCYPFGSQLKLSKLKSQNFEFIRVQKIASAALLKFCLPYDSITAHSCTTFSCTPGPYNLSEGQALKLRFLGLVLCVCGCVSLLVGFRQCAGGSYLAYMVRKLK